MKHWVWGTMFVVYFVFGTGLLIKVLYKFFYNNIKQLQIDKENKRSGFNTKNI